MIGKLGFMFLDPKNSIPANFYLKTPLEHHINLKKQFKK